MFLTIISYVYVALAATMVVLASLSFVHILQLESYQGKQYLKWVGKHFMQEGIPFLLVGIIALILRISYVFLWNTKQMLATVIYVLADVAYVALLLIFFVSWHKKKQIKPLVFTGRVKRLLIAEFIVAALFTLTLFTRVYYVGPMRWIDFLAPNILRYLPGMLMPFFVLLCYLITWPIEEGVKRYYANDAARKLKERSDLIKIGITGSFGKTSTKHFLAGILDEKYNVLFTPGSFNTPMGITKVVRGDLKMEHQVFIAEMGARYKGDIAELCKLVAPRYGIITSVGKQHLETFGSLENVIATKSELMEGLGINGACFFNGDNEHCRRMFEECKLDEKFLFGTAGTQLYMQATDIQVSSEGCSFVLHSHDGKQQTVKTGLLGKHNIENLLGAAALAYYLGLSMAEIAEGIVKLKPVEHRLQLIKGVVTVIDDAFNANPEGAREALNVLKSFEGRKIIVTPGMVELGEEEDALNREFGAHMADCTDIAIIIGKAHANPICEGLLEAGFAPECLVRVNTLAEATEKLSLYTEPGSVVLFENDLPDNYSE